MLSFAEPTEFGWNIEAQDLIEANNDSLMPEDCRMALLDGEVSRGDLFVEQIDQGLSIVSLTGTVSNTTLATSFAPAHNRLLSPETDEHIANATYLAATNHDFGVKGLDGREIPILVVHDHLPPEYSKRRIIAGDFGETAEWIFDSLAASELGQENFHIYGSLGGDVKAAAMAKFAADSSIGRVDNLGLISPSAVPGRLFGAFLGSWLGMARDKKPLVAYNDNQFWGGPTLHKKLDVQHQNSFQYIGNIVNRPVTTALEHWGYTHSRAFVELLASLVESDALERPIQLISTANSHSAPARLTNKLVREVAELVDPSSLNMIRSIAINGAGYPMANDITQVSGLLVKPVAPEAEDKQA